MLIVLILILTSIILIAFAFVNQLFETRKLKKEIQNLGNSKILISTENIDHNSNEFQLLLIEESELIDPKSFTRRIMKKCGKQKLPFVFWLDSDNTIQTDKFLC